MPDGLNKVMLIGNLGTDPEMRYTANGSAVTTFRLAVSRSFESFFSFCLEKVTDCTVSHIESIAHHREPHRVGAVQELPIFDRLQAQVGRDIRRASAVPARAMSRLWFDTHFVCCGT